MSKLSELLQVSDAEKQEILKHYNFTESDLEERINTLWEWVLKTDLPKSDLGRKKIMVCLLNCKMSLERTKRSLEGYYRVRTLYSDFFDLMLPNTELYNAIKRLCKCITMPKLQPDLCRLTICKFSDPEGEINDGLLYLLVGTMITELRFKTGDFFLSNTLLFDFQDIVWKNFIKFTPTVMQKLAHVLVAVNVRVKNIHLINGPDFIDTIVTFIKKVLPSKFVNKVCNHKSPESLFEYIPKEYLPSNFKGDQPSVEDLYEQWCEELERREEDFQKLLQAKLPTNAVGDTKEYEVPEVGWDGSFRKLSID